MSTDLTTTEAIELGLRTLALEGNDPTRAQKLLKDAGHQVDKADLEAWRAADPDRYQRIRGEVQHHIGPRMAQLAEDIARDALETLALAVRQTRYKLNAGSLKDPSTAAKNLASTADLAAKQAALIRGTPTEIRADRSAEEILRSLAGQLGLSQPADAETTAEQLNP